MPTTLALSSHFEDFVRQQIDSGRYASVSEVVGAGLRLLEEREEDQAGKRQTLRKAITLGVDAGPGIPAEMVFDRLEAKYAAMTEKRD
ncbi:type II toxin-antitoxin system ParD family antitoxin [Thiorhodovibrio frisius]|uniref:Antitoxin ParD n=1 Tax=Thiorhodovibrio frisius TaxID=631362 RepID=H8Z7R8_9GAMM|nr:type II toxin-antitoxin system ParD family antitoxin [Thiorhodovibrio frisius]EIC19921.1 putative addiction module antidote protein, CC2985 family [Thiorhodovibrio frisius]WPL20650.1 Antitoxin ParD1 [Thiorhodovibrio frisius]